MSFQAINRVYYHYEDLDHPGPYGQQKSEYTKVDAEQANLISSQIEWSTENLHAPVIDIDYPIEIYPSSQLGHHHLYLNNAIPFEKYAKVLMALADAGLCEPGYAHASISKGFSAVRPVGIVKPGVQPSAVKVLRENAMLRKEVYALKKELRELQEKKIELVSTWS